MVNKKEAVRSFVKDFSFIERELIVCVCDSNIDNFVELTPCIYVGNEVNYIDNVTGDEEVGYISEVDEINNKVVIDKKVIDTDDVYAIYDGFLPTYGTFFNPKESSVENWIEDNLEKVAKCGFRIYRYEETGSIYLGVDGCGYDFHKTHWEPLYDAIGIKWHIF